jgi:hypothetical protein
MLENTFTDENTEEGLNNILPMDLINIIKRYNSLLEPEDKYVKGVVKRLYTHIRSIIGKNKRMIKVKIELIKGENLIRIVPYIYIKHYSMPDTHKARELSYFSIVRKTGYLRNSISAIHHKSKTLHNVLKEHKKTLWYENNRRVYENILQMCKLIQDAQNNPL